MEITTDHFVRLRKGNFLGCCGEGSSLDFGFRKQCIITRLQRYLIEHFDRSLYIMIELNNIYCYMMELLLRYVCYVDELSWWVDDEGI